VLSRAGDNVTVQSAELRPGDKVVVSGLGFLRMAEVIAEEGAAHGHSH
jgi:multidrug efflux pump subunit AcrA (membrane-fusion protein)